MRTASSKPVRVLVVDDHEIVRKGVSKALSGSSSVAVELLEAATAREALEIVAQHHPAVVIVDVALPDRSGQDLTRDLRGRREPPLVVVFTGYYSSLVVTEMLSLGASAFVLKEDHADELLHAVDFVLSGERYLSASVPREAAEEVWGPAAHRRAIAHLTERERELLAMVAEGKTSKDVADALGISLRTAEGHRHNLMRKLGVHNVAELLSVAVGAARAGPHAKVVEPLRTGRSRWRCPVEC